MGVVIHILDRRCVRLDVAGTVHEIGTLRHLAKVTELDGRRVAELEAVDRLASPAAVLVSHPIDLPSVSHPGGFLAAHMVLGWDEGRQSVADLEWEYLPVLGYAVRDTHRDLFVLHELRDGLLHPIETDRAVALALLKDGRLVRHGQPVIAACHEVRSFIPEFAEADCVLADGRRDRFFVRIFGDAMPDPSWLVGRRPLDVQSYTSG